MVKKSLADAAAAWAAKAHGVRDALIVDRAQAHDPSSGESIERLRVVSASHPNGPAHRVFMASGGEVLDATPQREALFGVAHGRPKPLHRMASAVLPITIAPDTNTLVLNPTDTLDETLTVKVPKNAGPTMADVYFLADTTGSMSDILQAVKDGANDVLTALGAPGVDLAFGVGNYKDFLSGDPYCFQHQASPTNVAATVTAAINAWSATGGNDLPEGAFFALDSLAIAPGGTIGWRAGAKRIIVWFGDAAAHDPICPAASGLVVAITEASVTAKLIAQGIAVVAISTSTGTAGLDEDPTLGASDYVGACGAPGGSAGQATRIANATGGAFAAGIDSSTIVDTIIDLASGAIAAIQNIKLVPSPTIAPFITSITPAVGYGPLAGDTEHTLEFEVHFHGIPCKPEAQVVSGSIDVVADDSVVAAKRVQITVPPCAPRGFVYAVKFVCGTQAECECQCVPVRPGRYATEINLLNPGSKDVRVHKRFVPLVLAGAAVGREPRVAAPRAEDKIVLPPHSATMDDCCRIAELIFGAPGASPSALSIGYLEITSDAELVVTAVYTASSLDDNGVAIDVQQISAHRA